MIINKLTRQFVDQAIASLVTTPERRFICDTSAFSALTLMSVRNTLTSMNLAVTDMVIGALVYVDMLANRQFTDAMEVVTRHEELLTGKLFTMYGMTGWSDAYNHPEMRFVDPDEIILIGHSGRSDPTYAYLKRVKNAPEHLMPQGSTMSREVNGSSARDAEIKMQTMLEEIDRRGYEGEDKEKIITAARELVQGEFGLNLTAVGDNNV